VVPDQIHRDREIWAAYVSGQRQRDIADQIGISQSAVSQAVARYRSTLPPLDRAEELDRSLDLINELIATWKPKAGTSLGATRMVDRLVNTKAKLAGLVTATVHHEGQVDHAVVIDHGPTLEQVLDRYREQGLIRPQAQLTRTDGGP